VSQNEPVRETGKSVNARIRELVAALPPMTPEQLEPLLEQLRILLRPAPAPLLTEKQAADFLVLPPRTLTNWRYRRTGPKFVRTGRHIRYRMRDLEAWLTKREQDPETRR
jgi:hypothetical protein